MAIIGTLRPVYAHGPGKIPVSPDIFHPRASRNLRYVLSQNIPEPGEPDPTTNAQRLGKGSTSLLLVVCLSTNGERALNYTIVK